ncbi:MAG: HD-GYP domain-containing protein [Lachnospiraceae bacterium]|nr:HD-GYP domain-containing protein [Lachnospiraceae bacterium]
MRLVSISMLKPDMVLARSIYHNNTLVLSAGRTNINQHIDRLLARGIRSVYVEDGVSEGIDIPDAIKEKTRNTCKKVLRNTLEGCISGGNVSFKELNKSIDDIINEVLESGDIQVSLNDIGAADEYTYQHSVSVSVYSLLIGRALKLPRKHLTQLAMGGLIHDIGKIEMDQRIMFKPGSFTKEEYEYAKLHVTLGYQRLQDNDMIPAAAKLIAYSHHERMDGSGYPLGIKGDDLHLFSKITAIADVYDALTTDRCYRPKWPANKAVDYLIENAGTHFAPELVQLFIKQIAIFPNGSMVLLSTGETGIIKEQNRGLPHRPVVRVIKDAQGEEMKPYEIDLLKELNITIVESELEIVRNNAAGYYPGTKGYGKE